MQPLFKDKDKLESIVLPGDTRNTYTILPGCRYKRRQSWETGNETVDGDYYKVPTDSGKLAVVWVANDQGKDDHLKYFCHGHTFGTYEAFGYSLTEIGERVLDEWDFVGKTSTVVRNGNVALDMEATLPKELREASEAGYSIVAVCFDVPSVLDHLKASWHNLTPTLADGKTVHSFRIEQVAQSGEDLLTSVVSSKNSFGRFESQTTIRKQLVMYEQIGELTFLRSKIVGKLPYRIP